MKGVKMVNNPSMAAYDDAWIRLNRSTPAASSWVEVKSNFGDQFIARISFFSYHWIKENGVTQHIHRNDSWRYRFNLMISN